MLSPQHTMTAQWFLRFVIATTLINVATILAAKDCCLSWPGCECQHDEKSNVYNIKCIHDIKPVDGHCDDEAIRQIMLTLIWDDAYTPKGHDINRNHVRKMVDFPKLSAETFLRIKDLPAKSLNLRSSECRLIEIHDPHNGRLEDENYPTTMARLSIHADKELIFSRKSLSGVPKNCKLALSGAGIIQVPVDALKAWNPNQGTEVFLPKEISCIPPSIHRLACYVMSVDTREYCSSCPEGTVNSVSLGFMPNCQPCSTGMIPNKERSVCIHDNMFSKAIDFSSHASIPPVSIKRTNGKTSAAAEMGASTSNSNDAPNVKRVELERKSADEGGPKENPPVSIISQEYEKEPNNRESIHENTASPNSYIGAHMNQKDEDGESAAFLESQEQKDKQFCSSAMGTNYESFDGVTLTERQTLGTAQSSDQPHAEEENSHQQSNVPEAEIDCQSTLIDSDTSTTAQVSARDYGNSIADTVEGDGHQQCGDVPIPAKHEQARSSDNDLLSAEQVSEKSTDRAGLVEEYHQEQCDSWVDDESETAAPPESDTTTASEKGTNEPLSVLTEDYSQQQSASVVEPCECAQSCDSDTLANSEKCTNEPLTVAMDDSYQCSAVPMIENSDCVHSPDCDTPTTAQVSETDTVNPIACAAEHDANQHSVVLTTTIELSDPSTSSDSDIPILASHFETPIGVPVAESTSVEPRGIELIVSEGDSTNINESEIPVDNIPVSSVLEDDSHQQGTVHTSDTPDYSIITAVFAITCAIIIVVAFWIRHRPQGSLRSEQNVSSEWIEAQN
uniref:Uncharacterized protein n=1 Tax=Spongospora subterranea TaxID=70186 RepID=A0A0H5R8X1_9EUKA|eukprot:CRZ10570.1 hypothetical protein [Spongospora subterranea]